MCRADVVFVSLSSMEFLILKNIDCEYLLIFLIIAEMNKFFCKSINIHIQMTQKKNKKKHETTEHIFCKTGIKTQ